jgi:two-component system cell cycle response regulator
LNKIVIPGLVLYSVVSGLGLFLGPGLSSNLLIPWLTGFAFLLFIISYRALFSHERPLIFEYLMLGIIAVNFVIQITGGAGSPFIGAYFLLAAAAAFQSRRHASYLVAIMIAIEAANLIIAGQISLHQWLSFGGFAISLAGVVIIIALFTSRVKDHARIARERYQKLLADAHAVDPLASDIKTDALSEESRQATNISTAVEREGAFKGLISMIYEMVPAHTYALFLADREEGLFTLRAIRSQSRDLKPVGVAEIEKGHGLIGISIDKNQPQYLKKTVIPSKRIGYYTQEVPIQSLLAIPITQGERVAGVLVVDSLERDAFSPEDQDLLARFAPFFGQIIEKIRISQELDLRAKNFSALHDMSSILSSSLEISDVLDKLCGQLRSVIPHDFCVFLHYDEKSGNATITALRGYDAKLHGSQFPLEQSVILKLMHTQWKDQNTAMVYYDPALGERSKDIGLFPIKEMQRSMQSLYGRPLIAQNRFIGAFFLGSVRTNAFTEYHRNFMDTLLNQVAMVVDNSMMHQNIRDMARTDGLTGLLNHRTFMEKLSEEYKRIDREARPFSILLMDIDKFKNVNDTYGHPVGDVAIKAVAKVLKDTVRNTDFVARYGGEEFTVGMVDTNGKGAELMAERVRRIMEDTVVTRIGARNLMITLSIGVASYPEDTKNPLDLVTMADNALYHAKRSGRNKVGLYRNVKDLEPAPAKPGK